MKKILLSLLVFSAILSVFGCEPASEKDKQVEQKVIEKEALSKGEKILVYMAGSEAMLNKLEATFEKTHGDVLDVSIMSCGHLRRKVWAESQAGDIQADVFWGSNPLLYNKLDALGKLAPLHLSNLSDVKQEFIWPDKNYQLINERFIVLIYNKNNLKVEAPRSYQDLLDSRYNGLLVEADATLSSTAFAIASSIYQLMGNNDEYFKGLKKNNILLTKSNGLVSSAVMEGQAVIGISPLDAVVRLKKKAKKAGFKLPVQVVMPREGVISMQRPIAVSASASRSDAKSKIAQDFVDFMLSKPAQMITDAYGMGSVRKDIATEYIPKGTKMYKVDWTAGVENEDAVQNAFQDIFH